MDGGRITGVGIVRAGIVFSLVLVAAWTACGEKAAEKAAEKTMEAALKQATGEDVDIDVQKGGDVHIRGRETNVDMVETSEWPADMFPGVPEFTFGKIHRVHSADEGGMRKFNVFLKDVSSDAVQRYAEQLEAAGWQTQVMQMGAQGAMVSGQKDDLGIHLAYGGDDREAMLAVFRTGTTE